MIKRSNQTIRKKDRLPKRMMHVPYYISLLKVDLNQKVCMSCMEYEKCFSIAAIQQIANVSFLYNLQSYRVKLHHALRKS